MGPNNNLDSEGALDMQLITLGVFRLWTDKLQHDFVALNGANAPTQTYRCRQSAQLMV